MSVRSEKEAAAVVAALLKPRDEDTEIKDLANACIKALDDLRSTTWRPIGPPLQVGQQFKWQFSSKMHFVAWTGEDGDGKEYAWIITPDSDYGFLALVHSPVWRWTTPVQPSKGVTRKVQAKDERGELLFDENDEPVKVDKYYPPVHESLFINAVGMVPGDCIKFKDSREYSVEAVFTRGILLRERESGMIWAEENGNLSKYYTDGWRR